MTITQHITKDAVPGYETGYLDDRRNFEFTYDGWTYRGQWRRISSVVNDVVERINPPSIDLTIADAGYTRFKVHLWINASGEGYRIYISEKQNVRGAWRSHESKLLDNLIEIFWKRYNSLDFQTSLLERAELEARDEIRGLKERIQLLEDYALNLKRQREELLDN